MSIIVPKKLNSVLGVAIDDIKQKYGDFLKKFELYWEEEPYDRGKALMVKCEDGRKFVGLGSYGIKSLDAPYKDYPFTSSYQDLLGVIESAYCKTLPRMDRIMREMYK